MDIINIDESNIRQNLDVPLFNYKSVNSNYNKSTEGQDVEFFSFEDDSQGSNQFDDESVTSDLSDTTNVDANKYIESNDLFSEKPKDPKIYIKNSRQKNSLANMFIRFFNRYSKCTDYPLLITLQTGRAFIENLKLPNFGWRKEVIYKYEGLEYGLEFRTWKNVEQNIPIRACVMPIILYSDATLCDYLGKTSRHSVFMTLGNIPLTRRNKIDAKILFGYIPTMLQLLRSLSNTENIIIRNKNTTKASLRQGNSKKISVHHIRNALWKRPYFNVYTMCVLDHIHHADLGLFQYQLWFTVDLLNLKYGGGPTKILEEHLSQISHYPNLKVFKNGFEKFNKLTASEYRDLMKITIFALDELIPDRNLNKQFWRNYLLPSICQFGFPNGYTSETYELLHKYNIKQPYRMTNK
ncbi:26300_t:CDS:2 [Dentiscutata erythropus]|uniref:26300_t:CDS:1 n=1 Tax=Dentiscutata erythropus TaxID=1348616 RepID=A0A9N9C9S8_9GLOM|nr:26300_t:CDS:2 [Dentiscutata erythropus]